MKLLVQQNATSQLATIFVQNSSLTTGGGLTGLAYNTASLTAYYFRQGDASSTQIVLATMTLGTWATSGFIVVDATHMPGVYQIGIPNAALTALGSVVIVLQGAANMAPVVLEIQVVAYNPNDGALGIGSYAIPLAPTSGTVAEAWLVMDCLAGRRNTATAGSSNTITLDAGASATANSYVGDEIKLLTGTGAGAVRTIIAYNTGTLVATVDRPWDTNPVSGTTFQTLHIAKADVYNWNSVNVTGMPMPTYTQPTGFLAATFPSGTIANTTNITAGTITTTTNLTNAPTSGDFTATMKTSIGTAVAASAVASVTGNVTGSVGSINGVTFPTRFSSLAIDGAGDVTYNNAAPPSAATLAAAVAADFPTNFGAMAISAGGGVALASNGLDAVAVEVGLNARQALSICAAALAGVLAGAGTTTITINGAGVATLRITATVDANGDRSSLTLAPPA